MGKSNLIILENKVEDDRWITDYESTKKAKKLINLVEFERYFGNMSRKGKAARMGCSEDSYNQIKKEYGLNEGGKHEELINSTIFRGKVMKVWSELIYS